MGILGFRFVLVGLIFMINMASSESLFAIQCNASLVQLNTEYVKVHEARERAYWASNVGLKSADNELTERTDKEFFDYISDPKNLERVQNELKRSDLRPEDRLALEGLRDMFKVSVNPPEAAKARQAMLDYEAQMHARIKANHKTGYIDPTSGKFIASNLIALRNLSGKSKDEAVRKAAYEGMLALERANVEAGFAKLIELRNNYARSLGYDNFYAMKLDQTEKMTMPELFNLFDDFEKQTREATLARAQSVAVSKGLDALQPWNYEYNTSGELVLEKEKYFSFSQSVARSFRYLAGLGVDYNNALVIIDPLMREGKKPNGFARAPIPGYLDPATNQFVTTEVNLTSTSIIGIPGISEGATITLIHELGHAAHFSNVFQLTPARSQENAPTSIGHAEIQSMFLDSHVSSPEWLTRFAKDLDGNSMPQDLIERSVLMKHQNALFGDRRILGVSYLEKWLYEHPDPAALTPDQIIEKMREVEALMGQGAGMGRPLGITPHIYDDNASAYYHGYLLAEFGVSQTTQFFMDRDGSIIDNPKVGADMKEFYWKTGNSKGIAEHVKDLTGKDFSPADRAKMHSRTEAEVKADIAAALEREKATPHFTGSLDSLNIRLRITHGDEVVASNEGVSSTEDALQTFSMWIESQEKAAAESKN